MEGQFATALALPADGVALVDEPEEVKGVRLLRVVRELIASDHHVCGLEVDGVMLCLLEIEPVQRVGTFALPPEAEL